MINIIAECAVQPTTAEVVGETIIGLGCLGFASYVLWTFVRTFQ